MNEEELHRILDGHGPVTDSAGRLRVEIAGSRRRVVYRTWAEAADLWDRYPGRIGILCIEPPATTNEHRPDQEQC